jgi:hypothetical protein
MTLNLVSIHSISAVWHFVELFRRALPGLLTLPTARQCCHLMIDPIKHTWTNSGPDWTTIPNAQMLLFPILSTFPKVPIRFMTPCRVHKAPAAKETIPLFGRSFFQKIPAFSRTPASRPRRDPTIVPTLRWCLGSVIRASGERRVLISAIVDAHLSHCL